MVRVNNILDDVLKKRDTSFWLQISTLKLCLVGKVAVEEVLRHNLQEQPLTLKSSSWSFQKIELPHSKSSGLKEQFYTR